MFKKILFWCLWDESHGGDIFFLLQHHRNIYHSIFRMCANHKTQNIARSFADYRMLCKRRKNPTQKIKIVLNSRCHALKEKKKYCHQQHMAIEWFDLKNCLIFLFLNQWMHFRAAQKPCWGFTRIQVIRWKISLRCDNFNDNFATKGTLKVTTRANAPFYLIALFL